jgi:hypothetical protein
VRREKNGWRSPISACFLVAAACDCGDNGGSKWEIGRGLATNADPEVISQDALAQKSAKKRHEVAYLGTLLALIRFEHGTLNLVGSGPVAILWRVATGHGFLFSLLFPHLQLNSSPYC